MNGGTLHASILNAGTVGFGGGDLYAGNDLAIAPAATLSGAAATAGNLTVSGASTISAGAVLLAGGSITVTGTGDVAQTGGTVAAAGNVTITANGGVSQTGGTIASGGTILLHGIGKAGTSVSFAGTLEGASVELVEPGYGVAVLPTLGGLTSVTVQGLSNVFHCPGCDTLTPSSTYGSTIPTPAPTASYLRIDGQTVALNGSLSVGTLELHSVRGTTQSTPFSTGLLIGTAGYGVDAGGTGLPTLYDSIRPGRRLARPGEQRRLARALLRDVRLRARLDHRPGRRRPGRGGRQPDDLADRAVAFGLGQRLAGIRDAGGRRVRGHARRGHVRAADGAGGSGGVEHRGPDDRRAQPGGRHDANLRAGRDRRHRAAHRRAERDGGRCLDMGGRVATCRSSTRWARRPMSARPVRKRSGSAASTGPSPRPRTLTIAGSIALTNSASTLGLYAQGNITETAGGGISIGGPGAGAGAAVEVGTITGSAGGSVALVGTLGEDQLHAGDCGPR